jgi:hypothetical protein
MLVLSAMRTHSAEPAVQAEGCHALRALLVAHQEIAQATDIADKIVDEDGLHTIISAMQAHKMVPDVPGWACGVLISLLTTANAANAFKVAQSGVVAEILKAMHAHPTSLLTQEHGSEYCECLLLLFGDLIIQGEREDADDGTIQDTLNRVVAEIVQHDGVAAFAAAMRAHSSVPKVQRHACRVLNELLRGLAEDVYDTDDAGGGEGAARKEQQLLYAEQAKRLAEMATKEGVAELVAAALLTHTHETVSVYSLLNRYIGFLQHRKVTTQSCAHKGSFPYWPLRIDRTIVESRACLRDRTCKTLDLYATRL